MHCGRRSGSYEGQTVRVWRLQEEQFQALASFLTEVPAKDVVCPLPLRSTKHNWRTDEWDAIVRYHIYRDPWERKVLREKDTSNIRYNTGDYPELESMFTMINSGPSYDVGWTQGDSGSMEFRMTWKKNESGPVERQGGSPDSEPRQVIPTPMERPPSGIIWEEARDEFPEGAGEHPEPTEEDQIMILRAAGYDVAHLMPQYEGKPIMSVNVEDYINAKWEEYDRFMQAREGEIPRLRW